MDAFLDITYIHFIHTYMWTDNLRDDNSTQFAWYSWHGGEDEENDGGAGRPSHQETNHRVM